MSLTAEEKKALLHIARTTIEAVVKGEPLPEFSVSSPTLEQNRGAFVTIHTKDGRLRGCIGLFQSADPLYKTVSQMAKAAATDDPRFSPLREEELRSIRIEISVLSPLERIDDVEQIEVGRHGIYIVKGNHRGVLLPQVAVEYGLDRYQFLDHTCLKAGLPPGCWREGADIYIFDAEVFGEQD